MESLQLRNFKDFFLLYNQIAQNCFVKCVSTFMSRDITPIEESCIKTCAEKHINANHRVMEIFMEVQPVIIKKKMEEAIAIQSAMESAEKEDLVKDEQLTLTT